MKLEIIKNHKSGNRHYLKGKTFDIPKEMLQWKADELIKSKAAKYQEIETTMKKEVIETR